MINKSGVILAEDDRLVVIEDLVDTKGKIVENLEVDTNLVLNKRPSHCPNCHSDKICGIEVMGEYDGILLWECDVCNKLYLRFKEAKTEKILQSAKDVWTNPRDWGYVPPSKFN